jgi:hypothetical protein
MPNLANLRRLELVNSGFVDFNHMPCFANLADLILDGSDVLDFEHMPSFPKLDFLSLNETGISSFLYMPELPQLKMLSLINSDISDFEDMPSLPNLESLYLGRTPLDSLNDMPYLPKLQDLNVYQTHLSEEEIVDFARDDSRCPNLRTLVIDEELIEPFLRARAAAGTYPNLVAITEGRVDDLMEQYGLTLQPRTTGPDVPPPRPPSIPPVTIQTETPAEADDLGVDADSHRYASTTRPKGPVAPRAPIMPRSQQEPNPVGPMPA